MSMRNFVRNSVIAFSAFAAAASLDPRVVQAAEPGAVTMTVTAVGKKDAVPPPIAKSDVELYKGKERLQVADWRKSDALLLAIIIDDSLRPDIASQWRDLKTFIEEQPASTLVGVFYGRNGTVMIGQDF